MASADQARDHASARVAPEPNALARRLFMPTLTVAILLIVLSGLAAWGGSDGGLGRTLAPVIVLLAFGLVGLLFACMAKVKSTALAPATRLQTALRRVPDEGVAAVSGLRDPGLLGGVVREVSALLEAYLPSGQDDAKERETVVRGRLETVLRDLHDGVLICTLDHQVLLYNRRALEILHVTGDVGLDRPLFETLAERPFRHALLRLQSRFASGRHAEHADGLSIMLIAGTVDGRHTIKGRMSLMMDDAGAVPVGYVVTFEDVTNALSTALYRERALFDIRDDLRARLTGLTAKADAADMGEDMAAVTEEIERLDTFLLDVLAGAWPMSAVFSTTLFHCIAERDSEGRGLTFTVEGDPVWLHCDSASITDLLDRLANRLAIDFEVKDFRVIATLASDGDAFVDLLYTGEAVSEETLSSWLEEQLEPDLGAVTGGDILHRHRTQLRVDADIGEGVTRLRLPLKVAAERYERTERSFMPAEARREFYDFDLLHRPHASELDKRPLRALTSVVFDTETTGLEPSKGDEIISIGAVRIVNGRVLRGEIFNEFVNPQRTIPAASTKIHGITDAMVADAPGIEETLPRFHGFVGPGALIAHNAAFDMKFLSLKEAQVGVRFNQPVLDTLLLAAHALGRDESLSLDGLSERFGVVLPPEDRHTALGDALATGEVFIKLLPLLEAQGVVTLADALAASDRQIGLRRMQEQF
ncbi:MAG: PAS domain-containing protein [Rhizobiales bacterium]|nr:PAS domain-containing protein [Hyphomicrobiales bacterium]MBO6697329.1 PAS domain-containing protein [Hyphomicrobiales bacterium]MBO6736416.1 PAS domain-containing protein [Hyphomicrobiales bacterium]MBO6912886.1 PAS domain-containing protein [Hyphomicrobiales bacterium]MBO6954054.1 PAS domain-containing protein [Hyphomicrobiales bacterium]